MNKTKKMIILGLLVSQALVLSIIESRMSFVTPIPGFKLGLANIITVIVIVLFGFKESIIVVITRCILAAVFSGGVSVFLFSVTGGVLAAIVMFLLFKVNNNFFSLIGISVGGAVAHNIGQISVAVVYMKDFYVVMMLPYLLIAGSMAGIITGIMSTLLLEGLKKSKIIQN